MYMIKTPLSILILVSFLMTGIVGPMPAYAKDFRLPAPGAMVHLSPEFNPPILKGIKVHPENPFRFDFILDKGDSELSNDALKDESSRLIKYFLASLTIPEKDLWVNLSPYEKDRIIPNSFGLTEMGRDLLAEDYMLKQITASLIYPEDEVGKKFWKRIYEEATKKFGTTNIPVNTFNKVWIVPEKAVVYENAKNGTAYVVESKLKVMLEQDYLSLQKHEGIKSQAQVQDNATNQLGNQIVREIVIPELAKEVNEGKNFSQLRQVYNSLILAAWYKKKIKDSILSEVYADKNKVAGVNNSDPQEKYKIYQRYLKAFKKGVYNYVKDDHDPFTQQPIPKKYFSGGVDATDFAQLVLQTTSVVDFALTSKSLQEVSANLAMAIDQAMTSRIVNPIEIQQRFDKKRTPERRILMGFMRDSKEQIQPIFSNLAAFQSTREIEAAIFIFWTGWNPQREIRNIPLDLLGKNKGVSVIAINKTVDWQALPDDLRALFEKGTILVTSSTGRGSGYSVLMAVTPQNGRDKSEGRSGVLLKDGLPIVIEINGKEFLLEIKGVGNAEGGFDADYRFLRGGAQVSETEKELGSLEMKRKVGRAFNEGDAVRAVAELNFTIDGRQQGYLIRLSPGSVRATYNDNVALQLGKNKADRVSKVAQDMGRQMGEYYSEGFVATSHPENLVVVDEGRSFIFTDYSDILPIHIFPTELEGRDYDLYGVIRASLHTVTEIPGYKKYGGFESFLKGLADGLLEAGKITATDKIELIGLSNFDQIRDFLWKKFMAADYYKEVKAHGKTPRHFQYLKAVDPYFQQQLVSRARREYADKQEEISEINRRIQEGRQENEERLRELAAIDADFEGYRQKFNRQREAERTFTMDAEYFRMDYEQQKSYVENFKTWERDKEKEVRKLEGKIRILESTGFTADGIITVTNSVESRQAFKAAMQTFNSQDFWSSEYYVIWKLWDDVESALALTAEHLQKEVDFLGTVLSSASPDLTADVQINLQKAKERLAELRNMNPHDFYLQIVKNPEYAKQMAILPYTIGSNQHKSHSAIPHPSANSAMVSWQDFVAGGIKENPVWAQDPVYQRFRDRGLGDSNTDPVSMVTGARQAMEDFDIKVKPDGVGLVLGFGRKGIGELELSDSAG